MRSVPLWCRGEVRATSAPQSKAALAMRMSSVAMITASNSFAFRQRSQTCRRSGLPAMGYNGLPLKRVDPQRAGIIPTASLIQPIQYDLRRRWQIVGHPVGTTTVGHPIKARPHPDSADAGVVRAFGVDLFVTDEERPRKIDIVVASCSQDHSRRRLAAFGGFAGHV